MTERPIGRGSDISDLLSPAGPVAATLGAHFEPRPEQQAMADAVARAMDSRSHLLVEAGTGVGKSFAYLVPAILRATRFAETVLVATNTIALQEQLIQRDIPLLDKALAERPASIPAGPGALPEPRPLRAVLVKGRGNYVSLRRLKLASQRQDKLFADPAARRSLHVIEDWALTTSDGSLSTLPVLERPGVWDKAQSDSGNCMGRKCPTYEKCFYQAARAQMDGANLLVTNHALFFADLALRGQDAGFLPTYDHVILDEAHNVEDVASDHFGVTLNEPRVNHLLSTLCQPRSNKGYLPQLQLLVGERAPVDRALRLVEQAALASRAFFDGVLALLGPAGGSFGGSAARGKPSTRIREPNALANPLTPAFRELSLCLTLLKDAVRTDADRYELNAYAVRAELNAADAEALVTHGIPGCAYWAECDASDSRSPRVSLACSPVEVAPILKERLFSRPVSVTLTSATLATRFATPAEPRERSETAFAHTLSRLGCEGAATLQLGSPFDYARQVRLLVDMRAENPRAARASTPPSRSGLSDLVLEHIRSTGGGAFVLFTSYATLNQTARALAEPLRDLDMPLLVQGQDAPRTELLERFRRSDRAVLFGAASFWQGVDVRGNALRNVIITKLPFDPPDRPLTEARGELIESRGGDPFREDSLPRAVIRFKQGFGRLIRSKTDTGRVVVLDPRVLTASYARTFLAALPAGVRPRVIDAHGSEVEPKDG